MMDIVFITGIITPGAMKKREYFNPYTYSVPIASLYNYFKDKVATTIFIPDIMKGKYREQIPPSKIYALSITYPEMLEAISLVKYLKNCYPESKVVVGGQYVTLYDDRAIQLLDCDYIIRGDGIPALEALLDNKPLPDNVTSKSKRGITLLNHYDVSASSILDRNAFYGLDWQAILSNPYYDDHSKWVVSAKGCYYGCSFCTNKAVSNCRILYRDMDKIVADVQSSLDADPLAWIFLSEPLASARGSHRKYLKNLVERIYKETSISKKNKLGVFIRLDDFNQDFADIFESKRDRLSINLMAGLDNFNNDVLHDMHKKMDKDFIFKSFEFIKKFKFPSSIVANIILGTPGYSQDIFQENLEDTYKAYTMYQNSPIRLNFAAGPLWLLAGSEYYAKRYLYPDIFETDEDINTQLRYTLVDGKYLDINVGLKPDWYAQAKRDSIQYLQEISRLKGHTV